MPCKLRTVAAAGALALVGVTAAPLAMPTATAAAPAAAAPRALVKPVAPKGVWLGAVPNMTPSAGTLQNAATFTAETGRPPAVVSYYVSWAPANGSQWPLPSGIATAADNGAIPMISWSCGAPDAAVASGTYDSSVVKPMALAMKAYGRPLLLRWFWEMNLVNIHKTCLGSGTASQNENDYKLAWIHVWQVFQKIGATNVAFVWAPSASYGNAKNAPAYWPATATGISPNPCATAQCVDWIGADLYDRKYYDSKYGSFAGVFATFYGLFKGDGKPMILSETGASDEANAGTGPLSQQVWLDSIKASARSEFPDLHAIVYVDGQGRLGSQDDFDYILQPGSTGMAAWKALAAAGGMQDYPVKVDTYGFATTAGTVHVYDGYSFGSITGQQLPGKIVGFAFGPHASGYWLTGADGSVYALGGVSYLGSMRGMHLNKPIVAMAATPDGRGYWLVASDGGIFNYGDARFYGSAGSIRLHRPIVGMASTADGHGYWLVASDGGMFAYGDAKFRGSMGGQHLNKPIDGMASTGDGGGYWLVASDGGIFTFGDAHFGGSLGGDQLAAPVSSAARDLVNGYYVVLTQAGTVYQFPGGTLASTASETSPAVQIATCPIASPPIG